MKTKQIYQATTEMKQFHLRLPAKLHIRLKTTAEKNGRSMSLEIVEVLEAWQKLKENEHD